MLGSLTLQNLELYSFTIMPIYDYMTPFEDEDYSQERVSPMGPLPQSMTEERTTTSSAGLETPYFDSKVRKHRHRGSTKPASSDIDPASSPYHGSGLMHVAEILLPENPRCYVCTDTDGAGELKESGTERHEISDRCPRCHSLLHGRVFPVLHPNFYTIEEQYDHHQHVDNPLHDECSPLEEESDMLERESDMLEYEANPLEQATYPPENLDIAMPAYATETSEQQSQPKAGKEEWNGHCPAPIAQQQPQIGNVRLPLAHGLKIFGCQSYKAGAQPKSPGSGLRPVPFYGKCL